MILQDSQHHNEEDKKLLQLLQQCLEYPVMPVRLTERFLVATNRSKSVYIKALRPPYRQAPPAQGRFKEEVTAWMVVHGQAGLPNIISSKYNLAERLFYIEMEAVPGQSLAQVWNHFNAVRFPFRQRKSAERETFMLEIWHELYKQVKTFHKLTGRIHGDLSENNIYVVKGKDGKYSVGLIDLSETRCIGTTYDANAYGEPRYAPPGMSVGECVTQEHDYGYSARALSYLLTGGNSDELKHYPAWCEEVKSWL